MPYCTASDSILDDEKKTQKNENGGRKRLCGKLHKIRKYEN